MMKTPTKPTKYATKLVAVQSIYSTVHAINISKHILEDLQDLPTKKNVSVAIKQVNRLK